MTLSLIITTYNRPDALELVLLSVLQQSVMPNEVIIADDGSTRETENLIIKYKQKFPIPLHHSWIEDKGFRAAKSRNNAILIASSDYIVFIDGDIIMHKHFIKGYKSNIVKGEYIMGSRALLSSELTKQLIENKVINVRFWSKGLSNRFNAIYLPFIHHLIQGSQSPLRSVKSANMGFWRSDIFSVNGFDEQYEGWGREDSDLAVRFSHAGIKRKNIKGAIVAYHLYHQENDRSRLQKNDVLIEKVINSDIIKAKIGLKELSGDEETN